MQAQESQKTPGCWQLEPEIPLTNEPHGDTHILSRLLAKGRQGVRKADLPPSGQASYNPSQEEDGYTTPKRVKTRKGSFSCGILLNPTQTTRSTNHRVICLLQQATPAKKEM